MTFIDNFSRKTWVYFWNQKYKELDYFKKLKAMIKKEIGEEICCLRSDKGGAFNSHEFKKICEENGIKTQIYEAYTPKKMEWLEEIA